MQTILHLKSLVQTILHLKSLEGEVSLEVEGPGGLWPEQRSLRWLHLGQIKARGFENKAEQKKTTPQDSSPCH